MDENRLVPFDKLTPETVVYWRALTQFLFAEAEGGNGAAADYLERLLPELTEFCIYVRVSSCNLSQIILVVLLCRWH